MVSYVFHVLSKNMKDYASSKTLHEHLFRSGFMSDYIYWTKYEKNMVIMKDDKEQEEDDNIIRFVEYGAFDDIAMGEVNKR